MRFEIGFDELGMAKEIVSGHCKLLARASAHAGERGMGYISDALEKTENVVWSCADDRWELWSRTATTATTKTDGLTASNRRWEYQTMAGWSRRSSRRAQVTRIASAIELMAQLKAPKDPGRYTTGA